MPSRKKRIFVPRETPRLFVSSRSRIPKTFGLGRKYPFRYEVKTHSDVPHVVKFSGGRSSGMLLFVLLESGLLRRERGDVVVFNNTSAEHPETYKFAALCKSVVEEHYGIPFFWLEFQTYEDARNGEWTRLPSYRLVQPKPRSERVPDGYLGKGETFEEMLSWAGFVPNQFQRTCTKNLKLRVTRLFLRDWFACKEGIERLGHHGEESRLDDEAVYARHRKHNGGVPRKILLEKKAYLRSRPAYRPGQRFADFSAAFAPVQSEYLQGKSCGNGAVFGDDGVEYVAFVGLRHDEMHRVAKVRARNAEEGESDGHEGEHVYMPLSDMVVTKDDVSEFWNCQDWNLGLPDDANLSNCVYCFLKGMRGLQNVHGTMNGNGSNGASVNGNKYRGTPCDIGWWRRIEETYGRNLKAENRQVKEGRVKGNFIGFFGASSGFSYKLLAQNGHRPQKLSEFSDSVLPCDCTD